MKIQMTDKQAGLVRFAIEILLSDETTKATDRKALEAVQAKIEANWTNATLTEK